ncbi:MAG: hypothetical protein BIFFINMI_04204 [Phycisphaerae bacterium]|nr:hypothetical protein [Phycisphaerae bacterium]
MIPDILAAWPQARKVFDGYGLSGCGGAHGPVESLEFFSRAHGVELGHLLEELRAATAEPIERPVAEGATLLADVLYRRFFKAAIIITLTFGATWGADLLWRIGLNDDFTAVSVFDVNAHGHAQIYGWVGLFIMGFAYQAFGRFRHVPLVRPGWANASFYLMIGGIVASVVGQIAHASRLGLAVALAGQAMELTAIGLFVSVVIGTYRASRSKGLGVHDGYIFASIAWFAVQALFGLAHLWLTMTAATPSELVYWVTTLQAPLRDMQIHGFAMMMILGVSLRLLPGVLGLPAISARRARLWLVLLNGAIVGEVMLFMGYRLLDNHLLAALLLVPWALLLVGAAALLWPWRLWRPLPGSDRSGKFVRAAFGWLALSMLMLVLLPAYSRLAGLPFSHAYYGAVRHAVTVGFVSMMILGMSAKVVPTLNGLDTRQLRQLWAVFILLNVGCALRVGFQIVTDFWPTAFALVGVSGVLEVTATAVWGVGLWRIMSVGARQERLASGPAPAVISPQHKVADVLAWFPQLEPVFIRFGFREITNPFLRRTVARRISLAGACSMHGRAGDALITALNEAIKRERRPVGTLASLPVIPSRRA